MSAGRLAPRGSRTGRTWSGGSGPAGSWSPGGPTPLTGHCALGGQSSPGPGSSPGRYVCMEVRLSSIYVIENLMKSEHVALPVTT